MITVLGLLFSITALATAPVPEGTELHVRLTTTVGSYASRAGSPIRAVLIAPVTVDGETILQPGSTLSGMVKAVTRVGLGVRHVTPDTHELERAGYAEWRIRPRPCAMRARSCRHS